MACQRWNEEWVAHLYGELEPGEATRLSAHLEECAACQQHYAELSASRELLAAHAPSVPAAPRVLLLQPRRGWGRVLGGYAAGLATAAGLFGAGLLAGPWLALWRPPQDAAPVTASVRSVTEEDLQEALRRQAEQFERRLASVVPVSSAPMPASVTPQRMAEEIDRLEKRMERSRSRDRDYLLAEITAAEYRAGSWIDETRNALRYVALSNDPRLSEQ